MNNTGIIFTRESILSTLERTHDDVAGYFMSHPADAFFLGQGSEWSPSQNLEHLIRSITPVTMALRLPRFLLRLLFGAPRKSSGPYEQVKEDYLQKLAKGARASGPYLPPKPDANGERSAEQIQLIEKWKRASADLIRALRPWDEQELDRYLLPHPILGKLTVREILFFTIYHDLRHMSPEGD